MKPPKRLTENELEIIRAGARITGRLGGFVRRDNMTSAQRRAGAILAVRAREKKRKNKIKELKEKK